MNVFFYVAVMGMLCYVLVKSADLTEGTFVLIARKFKVNTFLVGFVILGITSSLPEISIAISSSIKDVPELSIGDLLGADLLLLTLVVGLNTLIHKKIPFAGSFGREQVLLMLLLIATSVWVLLDQSLSFSDGILLLISYLTFVTYITYHSNHKELHTHIEIHMQKLFSLLGKSILGIIGLIISAKLIVDCAAVLAGPNMLNIPEPVIGLMIIALGTNIPEITILFRSHGREQEKMAAGGILGSACVNVGILGLVGLLCPQDIVDYTSMIPTMVLLLFTLLLFGIFAWTDKEITRREGALLLMIYLLAIVIQGILIAQPI